MTILQTPAGDAVPPAAGLLTFPDGFRWGAATAAFQIEGASHEDGRTDSIWDTFCRIPGAVLEGHDGAVATDHYHRYREDVALMAEMNLGAYRFSTSWARVCPDGGPVNSKGLDFYSRLVDELLGRGIEPWLTLYHWDLPQALEDAGGWTSRDTSARFADYAVAVHEALGDRVRRWTTLNEPLCSALLGYGIGIHAPGRKDMRLATSAVHHLLLGHGLATAALRERDADATLGITLNFTVADPQDPDDPADVAAAHAFDTQHNRLYLDPVFHGRYPTELLEGAPHLGLAEHVRDGDLETIAAPLDVLGVNYYHGTLVTGHRPGGDAWEVAEGAWSVRRDLPRTSMDWEVQPEGLRRLLVRLHTEYTGPAGTYLAVTENGAAFDDVVGPDGGVDDPARRDFLEDHVREVHHAITDGADVRAYFAWSFLDNFEWAYGYTQRFGIVRVDYDTLERTPKRSGLWYATTAARNAVPSSR